MTDNPWDRFLTDRDRAVIEATGYGARADLGQRPALLTVDMGAKYANVLASSDPAVYLGGLPQGLFDPPG